MSENFGNEKSKRDNKFIKGKLSRKFWEILMKFWRKIWRNFGENMTKFCEKLKKF